MAGYPVAEPWALIRASLFAVGMDILRRSRRQPVLLGAWLFTGSSCRRAPEAPTQHIGHDIVEGVAVDPHNRSIGSLSWSSSSSTSRGGHPGNPCPLGAGPPRRRCRRLRTALDRGWYRRGPRRPRHDRPERRVSLATLMKACSPLEVFHLALAFTTAPGGRRSASCSSSAATPSCGARSPMPCGCAPPGRLPGDASVGHFLRHDDRVTGRPVPRRPSIATKRGVAAPFWFAFVGAGVTLAWSGASSTTSRTPRRRRDGPAHRHTEGSRLVRIGQARRRYPSMIRAVPRGTARLTACARSELQPTRAHPAGSKRSAAPPRRRPDRRPSRSHRARSRRPDAATLPG